MQSIIVAVLTVLLIKYVFPARRRGGGGNTYSKAELKLYSILQAISDLHTGASVAALLLRNGLNETFIPSRQHETLLCQEELHHRYDVDATNDWYHFDSS